MFTEKAKRVVLHGTSREEKNTIFQVNAQFFKPSGRYLLDPYRGRSPLSTAAVVAKLRTHTKKTGSFAKQQNKYIDDISLSNDKACPLPPTYYITAVHKYNNRVTAVTNFTTVIRTYLRSL